MEKEDTQVFIPEDEFLNLLIKVREGDGKALTVAMALFEEDMWSYVEHIKMPKDDVMQTLRLELLVMLKK